MQLSNRARWLLELDHLVFDRHDIAVVEKHAGRGVKLVGAPPAPHILDREMNGALPNLKSQRQSGFAELVIKVLRPIPEALGIEACHVSHDNFAHQIVYRLALFLAVGMH